MRKSYIGAGSGILVQAATVVGAAMLLAAVTGCARGPNVSSELPLRRVVIYRNGVGYFERAGQVDEDQVKFRMRQRLVGDFLATLAIVERGGSSVRSASFPIDVEDESKPEAEPAPQPGPSERIDEKGRLWHREPGPEPTVPEEKKHDPNRLRDVVLSLDGKEHDLSIGYVAETPVWRPSYRVVVQNNGEADLQTWGIVQNLSGEDWQDVELTLVAGAPIAFQSTLGTPVTPARPIVNDSGEVISSVPTGETSLADAPPPPPAPPMAEPAQAPEAEAAYDRADSDDEKAPSPKKSSKADGYASRARPASAQAAAPAPMGLGMAGTGAGGGGRGQGVVNMGGPGAQPRAVSALAGVAVEAGTTRYVIPKRVTVPDESATMVLLLHQRVPGSAVFLFAPDPGVPDSTAHPFRVVRFTNATPGLLERGPIAVFEKASFLGQGVLEPLPPKATATVPFALERALVVTSEHKYEEYGARILRIEASELWLERDMVHQTTYKAKNGGNEAVHLLVRHPRAPGTHLHEPPPGTEDNTGAGTALVPVDLGAYGAKDVVVDERSPYQMRVDWMSDLSDLAVKTYLADPKSDQKVTVPLAQAWAVRDKLRTLYDERDKLTTEQAELERSMQETRLSLKSLEKNKKAADLTAKLTERLKQGLDRLDVITKRLIEIELAAKEQEVRFRDAIRDIHLLVPPTTNPGAAK
jgi:hypothetical protein